MLYIFFCVFLLLSIFTFLLFVPINIIINYHEKISLDIILLGIKINLPFNNQNKKVKKVQAKSNSQIKQVKKRKHIFSFGMDIFKIGEKSLIKILNGLTIKEITINIQVSGHDSASTALLYGKICSLVYTFCGILISQSQPKNYNINVSPNFLGDKINVYFNLHFCGNLFHILKSLLYFIKEYNNIKNK